MALAETIAVSAREAAVAGTRFALAIQLTLMLAFLPVAAGRGYLIGVASVTPAVLMSAAPLVLIHWWICRPEPPFIRWGYALVALYGPALILFAPVELGGASKLLLVVLYELAAAAVTVAYIVLWILGDWWLGHRGEPRIRRRWIFGLSLAAVLCAWVPFVTYHWLADGCLDRGGAIGGDWTCDF